MTRIQNGLGFAGLIYGPFWIGTLFGGDGGIFLVVGTVLIFALGYAVGGRS